MRRIIATLALLFALTGTAGATSLGQGVSLSNTAEMNMSLNNGSVIDTDIISQWYGKTPVNICVWYKWDGVKYASPHEWLYMFSKSLSGDATAAQNEVTLRMKRLNSDGSSRLVECIWNVTTASSSLDPSTNWHHYCCGQGDGTAASLSIDGVQTDTTTFSGASGLRTNAPLKIGSYGITDADTLSGGSWDNLTIIPTTIPAPVTFLFGSTRASYKNGRAVMDYNNGIGIPNPVQLTNDSYALSQGHPLVGYSDSEITFPLDTTYRNDTSGDIFTTDSDNRYLLHGPDTDVADVAGVVAAQPTKHCSLDGSVQCRSDTDCTKGVCTIGITDLFIPAELFGSGTSFGYQTVGCHYKKKGFLKTQTGSPITGQFMPKLPLWILGGLDCDLQGQAAFQVTLPFWYPYTSDGRIWISMDYVNLDPSDTDNPLYVMSTASIVETLTTFSTDNLAGTITAPRGTYGEVAHSDKSNIFRVAGDAALGDDKVAIPSLKNHQEVKISIFVTDTRTAGAAPSKRLILGFHVYYVNVFS